MKRRALSNVGSAHGAPMGRPSDTIPETLPAGSVLLFPLRWCDSDYDEGCAYWGQVLGTSIYCAQWDAHGEDEAGEAFARARSMAEAIALLQLPAHVLDTSASMIEECAAAYLAAAEFTGLPDAEEEFQAADWSADAIAAAERVCTLMVTEHAEHVAAYGAAQAGHDLWFTRNGHGVGFWEHDHGTDEGCTALDAFAKRLGEVDVYLGDDHARHFA